MLAVNAGDCPIEQSPALHRTKSWHAFSNICWHPIPCRGFFRKSCTRQHPRLSRLPQQNPSIPAPLRHKRISSLVFRSLSIGRELFQFRRGINQYRTARPNKSFAKGNARILRPSTRHKWSEDIVMSARRHILLLLHKQTYGYSVSQPYSHTFDCMTVWSVIYACNYLHAYSHSRSYIYSSIQSSSRSIDISTIRTASRLFGRPSHRMTKHLVLASILCRLWHRSGPTWHNRLLCNELNRSVSLPL